MSQCSEAKWEESPQNFFGVVLFYYVDLEITYLLYPE